MTWPDMNPNDLDTYVQDPAGAVVWFRSREAGLMHLDRDDRGLAGDVIKVNIRNGREVVHESNYINARVWIADSSGEVRVAICTDFTEPEVARALARCDPRGIVQR